MKIRFKFLLPLLGCLAVAVSACSNDAPEPSNDEMVQLTFNVNPFNVSVEPMADKPASRANAADVVTRIDYVLVNNSTYDEIKGTQLLADAGNDFGNIQIWLPKGNYKMTMTAANENNDEDGRYSLGKDRIGLTLLTALNRDVYGSFETMTIGNNTSYDIDLERIVGKVVLRINDDVPNDVHKIKLVMRAYYSVRTESNIVQEYDDFTHYPKIKDNRVEEWATYLIPQENTTIELFLYDANDDELGTTTIKFNVYKNRRTIIQGSINDVLKQTPFQVTINDAWGSDVNVPL